MNPYTQVTSDFKEEFYKLVEGSKSILITAHKGPDGDSVASVLLAFTMLKSKYPQKNFRIIYEAEKINQWEYFENYQSIEFVSNIAPSLGKFDLGIFLDGSEYTRFSNQEAESIEKSKMKKICIDHHKNIPHNFDLLLKNPDAASTTELLYLLFLENVTKVDKRIAEIALLGILSDTGNLQFIDPSKSYLFPIVQKLVNDGDINIDSLKSQYSTYSVRVFTVLQEFVKNAKVIKIKGWPNCLVTYISRQYLSKNNFDTSEVSLAGHLFINSYVRALENTPWGFVITPKEDGRVTIGLRSNPKSVNVRKLVEGMGIGSGHDLASGGSFAPKKSQKVEPKKCLEQVLKWMETYEPAIT